MGAHHISDRINISSELMKNHLAHEALLRVFFEGCSGFQYLFRFVEGKSTLWSYYAQQCSFASSASSCVNLDIDVRISVGTASYLGCESPIICILTCTNKLPCQHCLFPDGSMIRSSNLNSKIGLINSPIRPVLRRASIDSTPPAIHHQGAYISAQLVSLQASKCG